VREVREIRAAERKAEHEEANALSVGANVVKAAPTSKTNFASKHCDAHASPCQKHGNARLHLEAAYFFHNCVMLGEAPRQPDWKSREERDLKRNRRWEGGRYVSQL
jgi:hypothetical protein